MLEINHLQAGTREFRPESMLCGVRTDWAGDFSVRNGAGNPIIIRVDGRDAKYGWSDYFGRISERDWSTG
jgi:hypothetical protein